MMSYFSSLTRRTRTFWGGLLLTIVASLLFTACGGGTTAASPTPTTAPAATPTTAAAVLIKTGTATTKSGSKTVLTDAKGLTLYYFDPDTAAKTACTGTCAVNWPPLVFSGSGQPTADPSVTGKLTVVTTANGQQVEYNGHMLYTFKGDSASGTAAGDGLGGKWHVATPDLAAATAAAALIKTGTVGSKTVLTNAQGLTLYYFDPDTTTTTACTGGCAGNWPPLVFTGSGQPTADPSVTGKLTVVTTPNGKQVEYNGHMLYTFKGDSAAGTAAGDGLGGKWHVATPDLAPM